METRTVSYSGFFGSLGALEQVKRSHTHCCGRSRALSPAVGARCSTNSDGNDSGTGQVSFSMNRRQGLLLSAVVPVLSILQGSGVLQSARAAEEEALRLEKIRSEITKAVSKGKAAGVLRLAFHDAGAFNLGTKQGGMNGSIIYELERPESTGLKRSVRVLEKVKTALEPEFSVSWADLIAVAGAESVAICGGPKINVNLGRLDSLTPDPEGQMPEETLSATELKHTFQQKGFSTQEMVVLSGAHTIGNKGFGAPDIFDNTYYKTLTQKPWRDSQGKEMSSSMVGLQSDRNLTEDSDCMKWVNLYAEDENKFFLDFSRAYVKLVNTGAQWA
ncbi:unnamed protein product [Calypogeia fissa]